MQVDGQKVDGRKKWVMTEEHKRKMFEGKSEAERSIGVVRIVNPEEEYKLQIQMVADNFEKPTAEIVSTDLPLTTTIITTQPPNENNLPEKNEEGKKQEEVSFKCNQCGFLAKNKVGLSAHIRFKHKQ